MKRIIKTILSIALSVLFGVFFLVSTTPCVQAAAPISVQLRNDNTANPTNSIIASFEISNNGSESINLENIKIRYYFTVNGDKPQNFWCDWASVGTVNVTGAFIKMTSATVGADYYLEVGFTNSAGVLAAGSNTEIRWRFAKSDWSNYSQTDDYSFGTNTFSDSPKTPVYLNGALSYGTEPDTAEPIHNIKLTSNAGQVQTIDGIVTCVDGSYYYIQEPDADVDADLHTSEGMAVYYSGGGLGWNLGDRVIVRGTITLSDSRLVLVPASSSDINRVSSGNPLPDLQNNTILSINNYCEGMRVRLQNVIIGTIDADGNTPLYDLNGNTINIVHTPALAGITAGDRVDVTAVAVGSTPFHLLVSSASDVTLQAEDTTSPAITAKTPSGTGVPKGTAFISITFDEIVKAVSGKEISVSGGGRTFTADAGSIMGASWVGKTFSSLLTSFKDSGSDSLSLDYDTEYSVTIPSGAFIDIAGLEAPLTSWTFTTEPAPITPTVIFHSISSQAGEGGKISLANTYAARYSSTSFTVSADSGYKISDVWVDGVSVGPVSSYELKNITSDIVIKAFFIETPITWNNPYIDVAENDWCHDAVAYTSQKGLFHGTGNNLFSPSTGMNRAMFVTVLANMAHVDISQSTASFEDVDPEAWYAGSVVWASRNSIAGGVGQNRFAPHQVITRQEIITLLYNYAKLAGLDVSIAEDTALSKYSDRSKISDWAINAMSWATTKGVISGKQGNVLDPQEPVTRAEAAEALQRFCVHYAK